MMQELSRARYTLDERSAVAERAAAAAVAWRREAEAAWAQQRDDSSALRRSEEEVARCLRMAQRSMRAELESHATLRRRDVALAELQAQPSPLH
jgi:hypothetical protein